MRFLRCMVRLDERFFLVNQRRQLNRPNPGVSIEEKPPTLSPSSHVCSSEWIVFLPTLNGLDTHTPISRMSYWLISVCTAYGRASVLSRGEIVDGRDLVSLHAGARPPKHTLIPKR